jgi:hypothetical protein
MAAVKRIVCLANSRKISGRCIAGKEVGSGAWIRPVSDRPHGEVSEREREYEDGTDPTLLDVIDVPLKHPRPTDYQSENWELDPDYYWAKTGRASWTDLDELADDPSQLWINGSSTHHGQNDRVSLDEVRGLPNSLHLIPLDAALLRVLAPGEAFGNRRRRVNAQFTHNGVEYCLRVTDPEFERSYLAKPNGEYALGPCFVTISLGEPFGGYCYKLVAAIITRGRASRKSGS